MLLCPYHLSNLHASTWVTLYSLESNQVVRLFRLKAKVLIMAHEASHDLMLLPLWFHFISVLRSPLASSLSSSHWLSHYSWNTSCSLLPEDLRTCSVWNTLPPGILTPCSLTPFWSSLPCKTPPLKSLLISLCVLIVCFLQLECKLHEIRTWLCSAL